MKVYKIITTGRYNIADSIDVIDEGDVTKDFEYKNELIKAFNSYNKNEDLSKYLDKEYDITKKIKYIRLNLDKDLKLVTNIVTNEDLTIREQNDMLDWMKGQFSDGWGEGFQQRPIKSFKVTHDYKNDFSKSNDSIDKMMNSILSDIENDKYTEIAHVYVSWDNDSKWVR